MCWANVGFVILRTTHQLEARMSIRGRLLALAIGGVVPLLIVGLTVLWVVWSGKQQQLNESLEQQAELAAVVFDHWLDAQYQPLITIASYPPSHLNDRSALEENLKAALIHRKHWIDLRVLDASGRVVATYPAGAEDLPAGVADKLLSEVSRGVPDVETDWTRGEGRYILALAVPLEGGGAVIARIDGEALREPLPQQGHNLAGSRSYHTARSAAPRNLSQSDSRICHRTGPHGFRCSLSLCKVRILRLCMLKVLLMGLSASTGWQG